ncbi:OmpA family protein [Bradyrhizobium iriomotense]|uniref:OmpA family protein n=1 Tax=Bradyrhizobium iriomotense TaxID=441950 RepID=UPI0024E132C4|nr:OmpA family protein [Bradyrhizobium iriomotense]
MKFPLHLTVAILALVASTPAWALKGLPESIQLPPSVTFKNSDRNVDVEEFGQAEFLIEKNAEGFDQRIVQQGKHTQSVLHMIPRPKPDDSNKTWQEIKPYWLKGGWQIVREWENGATLKRAQGGTEVWVTFNVANDFDEMQLDIVEVGGAKVLLTLRAPSATPEKVGDKDDFPYLARFPGTTLKATSQDPSPLDVTVPQKDQERVLAGTGQAIKTYGYPASVSVLQFITAYREALAKAGWQVLFESQGLNQSDGILLAHYTQGGRDIWVSMHMGAGEIGVAVADAGADDLAARLDKDCHVPLYGVHFDFNKAILRDESEPLLNRVLTTLKGQPKLTVELQGHTDNVGSDDYNLKLSGARAQAVMQWLVAHGTETSRVSTQGYGKSRPVASNDSDEGRAKNRRVELARKGCQR